MRIEACGQTSEQRPHWMQTSASQMGISWAMLRFSYIVVAVGNVPSTGIALTGRSSPRLAIIIPSTSFTNGGAPAGTAGYPPAVDASAAQWNAVAQTRNFVQFVAEPRAVAP